MPAFKIFTLRGPMTDEQIAARLGSTVKVEKNRVFTLKGDRVGFRDREETFVLLESRAGLRSIARTFADESGSGEKEFPENLE